MLTKGRASPPPACSCIVGVCASRTPVIEPCEGLSTDTGYG